MRTPTVLCLACVFLFGQSAQNPPSPKEQTRIEKGKITANEEEGKKLPGEGVPSKGQLDSAAHNGKSEGKDQGGNADPEPDWWMIGLTAGLVLVGGGQVLVLVRQTGILNGSLVETKKATHLTRESLILTQRPKLIVRHVVVRNTDGERLLDVSPVAATAIILEAHGGRLDVVNVGGSRAHLTKYHSEMSRGEQLPMVPPYDGKAGTDLDLTLAPGMRSYIAFPTERYRHGVSMVREEQGMRYFWLLGWIEYKDDIGNVRQTGFCRKWSNDHQRFMPTDDVYYEYAD
jgi:hypothetical protein